MDETTTVAAALTGPLSGQRARDLAPSVLDNLRRAGWAFDRYNGWTNRETWNTHLWMSNDEDAYNTAREIVARHLAMPGTDRGPGAASEEAIHNVAISYAADELREWWDELFAPDGASPLSDAWSYAIARTDWRAVAEAFAE